MTSLARRLVCHRARQTCPVFPHAPLGLDDPAEVESTNAEKPEAVA
jgi:hypothetical protein